MNKRKQKLEVKSEEMLSAEPDSLILGNEGNSDWFFDNESSSLDITSSFLNDDFLNLLDIPINLDDNGPLSQENKEIFQDLKYTSTPKSRSAASRAFHDSGIDEPPNKRRLKENTSMNVVYGINEKIESSCNNSFVNLSQLSEINSSDHSFKRHVTILRKDVISKPKPKEKTHNSRSITKEQLVYYSGINDYNTAIALIKHIKMPKCEFSPFKMELITLMKMRLNLQWKDMAFRFSIPEKTLLNIMLKAIDIMSASLDDLLPWHLQKKVIRRSLNCFYIQALFCESTATQILIILVDGKKPVLFVSDSFTVDVSPLIILNKCAKYLIPGDIICVNDISGNMLFYKIDHSNTTLGINYLEESHFTQCTFVKNCQKIVADILNDFLILSKPEENMDLCKLLKIAGALTNVNSTNEVTSAQLQKLYQKSSRLVGKT